MNDSSDNAGDFSDYKAQFQTQLACITVIRERFEAKVIEAEELHAVTSQWISDGGKLLKAIFRMVRSMDQVDADLKELRAKYADLVDLIAARDRSDDQTDDADWWKS